VKVATWNINGIRARHAEVVNWAAQHRPDVLCLQEIKASPEQVPERLTTLSDYWSFWHGRAGGYSGVSIHLRRESFPAKPAFQHPSFDMETRMVEVRLGAVVLASVYVPNGGKDYPAKLEFLRQLVSYVRGLHEQGARVLLCGDMNIARSDVDVHPSQRNSKQVGQRPDERELFEQLFGTGLVDLGRELASDDERHYTWWPYWRDARQRNLGWRLDYALASAPLARLAVSTSVQRDYGTSDHAPVVFEFDALSE
jgi:exodeoxyribonuclease-3